MVGPQRVSITPEMVDRFAAYYRDEPAWGFLHIVLDDLNLTDADVDWCVEHARTEGAGEALALALILRSLSRSQRARLGDRAEVRAVELWP